MTRSSWKGAFFHPSLLKKVKKHENYYKIKTWSRSSTILREFIGQDFEVHNGRNFVPLTVKEEMVGHKFGEFASTRKMGSHKIKKGKKN